ncbi:MAG TPA: AAA family ATPase [Leptolyngbyaceae cyanobacterium]
MSDILVTIPGYRLTEQIYIGSRTKVYRGFEEVSQKPVAIKLLLSQYPTFNEIVQMRNQYTLAKNLDLTGIVKPIALENYGNGFALVMEDFGGISLAEYTDRQKLSLAEFLTIAIQIVRILEDLYKNRVIHKDIKPQNILINPQTKKIKLIDFSISSLLPRENQEIQSPNVLEGTLAYMSPEQTGRMNRGIDYRTDFYSLGVTFYELLTGQLPFQSNDVMELVHCHIARQPKPPIELNPAIPQPLDDIVMKLMAKTAEERYQSAFGLRCDLENCWQQWQAKGSIERFAIASRDITESFLIPEKLYGRETEVDTLLTAFNRIAAGTAETILVAGFSGIGKTAAINEVHKPIVRQKGYFIKGKFAQFKRDIPFSAWVQAFQNLMQQLLTESAESVQQWKIKILEVLGENGHVIIDVIPELELLIGKQPKAPQLEGSAAQNRFNLLFGNFIRVFATKSHPIVIFIDDLQWADSASLKLLELLMSDPNTQYLLLIGAYRDNEVFPAHPLTLTLDELRKSNAILNQISLAPLHQSALNTLIADTLSCPPEQALPLTEVVQNKTKGNPFFATQFLKSLYENELIAFNFDCRYWQCDIEKVRALVISDDVVEFVADCLQKLPINTQEVLQLAACIGNTFQLADLAMVYEKSLAETAADLWKALQEGLVVPLGEIYKFYYSDGNVEKLDRSAISARQSPIYRFFHDRVQQAAYFLIPESQKQLTHLKIGKLLLNNIPAKEREEKIFDIVNQLNMGVELITDPAERNELVKLNLMAGSKAKTSTAYGVAIDYFQVGIKLLTTESWETQYQLALALYESAAEAAYLNGDFTQMEKWAAVILEKATTIADRTKITEVKIQTCMARGKQLEAIEIGLQLLAQLGISIPEYPTASDIQAKLTETSASLMGKNINDLINLPLMKDPEKLAAMRILSSMFSPVYIAAPTLLPLIVCEQVILSVRYGNAYISAFGYANYGVILCGVSQDLEFGYQFGQLALRLVEKLNMKEMKGKTFNQVATFTMHWKVHIREALLLLIEAYQSAIENGELEFASYAAMNKSQYSYFSGVELTELERDIANYNNALAQLKQQAVLNWNLIHRQAVLNLLGEAKNPCELSGTAYNEEKLLPLHLEANDRTGLHFFYLHKSILCYLFGSSDRALANAEQAEIYLDGATGLLDVPVFYFYDSLIRLAFYSFAQPSERKNILLKVTNNQAKMRRWADCAPDNFLHKYELVEAARNEVLGNLLEAMNLYDNAIAIAKENNYVNEEALGNELAAKFYLSWGKETIAQAYLTNAYYAYARWGAKAKIEDLENRYTKLISPIINREKPFHPNELINSISRETVSSTTTASSRLLDLATVIKASQALSGEINFAQLLSTLMSVAIENAGASKGALILLEEDKAIVASLCLSGQACDLLFRPIDECNNVPASPLNYVWRTSEILLINNAVNDPNFTADPYINQHQPKSILCTPIEKQGKAIAILYLENNLTSEAFTPDRLEILKILSSQAAISIENARLYSNLEHYNRTLEAKVEARTAELKSALDRLQAAQEELIQSEKMAALGQLIAGIAHEINTPLGAIRSSAGNLAKFLSQTLEQLPLLFHSLSPQQNQDFLTLLQRSLQQEITLSTKEERQFKRALKRHLEELGIDNPDSVADRLVMMGIYTDIDAFIPLLRTPDSLQILEIAYKLSELKRGTNTINTATDRASKVVFALKTYARQDHSGAMIPVNLTEGIETVLTLYQNQLKHGVKVSKTYGELPLVLCYPDELNQVWTNLIHNSLQAMDYRGNLTIDVSQVEQQAKISITDTGKGIPEEIKSKIFLPFFTTKPPGEGSGLGLDIVKKIIQKHSGKIEVESIPGQTTFTIFIPIQPN